MPGIPDIKPYPLPDKPAGKSDQSEDQQLSTALSEAGSSSVEFTRVLERHRAVGGLVRVSRSIRPTS